MSEKFACHTPGCSFAATADRMWNLDRRATNGKLVVVCGRHAHDARGQGLRAYRLSQTLELDAAREAKRLEANAFFAAFKAAEAKARRNGRGNGQLVSSRQFVKVE